MDLIDRQAAIDAMEDIAQKCDLYLYCQPVENARRKLERLPTIDAVEVVRCKECKHRDPEDKKCDCGHGIIWQLPKEPIMRWISCSERLPEKNQMVITTIVGTDVIRMVIGDTFEDAVARVRKNVRVSVGYIEEDGWYGADGYPMIVAPIAWMPLPDPYREAVDD